MLETEVIVGIVVLLFGILLAYFGINYYITGKASLNWRTINGTIISSWKKKIGKPNSNSFNAKIAYMYEINGEPYISKRIGMYSRTGSLYGAEKLLSNYPIGSEVLVYYDPRKLERSQSGIQPRARKYEMMDLDPNTTDWERIENAKHGNALLIPGASLGGFIFMIVLSLISLAAGSYLLFSGLQSYLN